MTSPTPPAEPVYADRTFRSPAGIVGGVLLLLLICWIGGDALIRGDGNVPWLALAGMLTAVPLVVAFTLRPVVLANEQRIRIRNPFRTITMPWTEVADLRAGYSSELFTEGGAKYQMWAVPVSLRQRKKAARQQSRRSLDDPYDRTSVHADVRDTKARMAVADRTMADLRELVERAKAGAPASAETAESSVSVRWAYEVIAPAVVGVVLLVVLLAIG
ncbi:PH domain-containing protein [Streptomyces sp. NBC_01591]|uniref:PH domain-containing protein n=1 Tax=Streptomyces sp. NBC_01591 TaxID=2975888 RepID=UPI002DDA1C18|nr:PH domain-containing protein [Streptomyces sp. NBC_01591]WSD70409.1 PH domain-containing protein [Streptomyces sp. NBC_01591]